MKTTTKRFETKIDKLYFRFLGNTSVIIIIKNSQIGINA